MSYDFAAGWNLVSIPQELSDKRVTTLFPAATAKVYSYSQGGYRIEDSVEQGGGYWVKWDNPLTSSFTGRPLGVDTIPVTARWNLIGSVKNPVPVDQIVQNPPANAFTRFFGCDGGYFFSDTIVPGHAYFVKVHNPGTFILDGSAPAASPKSSAARPWTPEGNGFNRIDVKQAGLSVKQSTRTLWFGAAADGSVDEAAFEMPPTPPAGAFDVRFESQADLAVVRATDAKAWEMPIQVQSPAASVEVSWSVRADENLRYELVGMKGSVVTFRKSVAGSGSARIELAKGTRYLLTAGTVPAEFGLAQNYPNPFNPSTRISFDLPVASKVRLEVYNLLGQLVAAPVAGETMDAGRHTAAFDAGNLPSGVYLYRIQAGAFTAMKKMVLVK
jgi:hypothetical protein